MIIISIEPCDDLYQILEVILKPLMELHEVSKNKEEKALLSLPINVRLYSFQLLY